MAHVITVLGPIAPDDLGITLPHEHIFIDLTIWPGGRTVAGEDAIIDPVRHTDLMIGDSRFSRLLAVLVWLNSLCETWAGYPGGQAHCRGHGVTHCRWLRVVSGLLHGRRYQLLADRRVGRGTGLRDPAGDSWHGHSSRGYRRNRRCPLSPDGQRGALPASDSQGPSTDRVGSDDTSVSYPG